MVKKRIFQYPFENFINFIFLKKIQRRPSTVWHKNEELLLAQHHEIFMSHENTSENEREKKQQVVKWKMQTRT
jgi:hypothetical protein